MISVVLSYENGQRQDVLLAGVPRVGEHIRLTGTQPNAPSLVVEQVLWMEAPTRNEPTVLVVVRPHANGPRV